MILIGGVNLFLDSIVNVAINSKAVWGTDKFIESNGICILSIVTTTTFHYFAFFSVIFRAKRIFKVMRLTKKFLDRIYHLAQDGNKSLI